MENIRVFGAEHTHGYATNVEPPCAWPNLIATDKAFDLFNHGTDGSSVKETANTVLWAKPEGFKESHVVILWPAFNRHTVFAGKDIIQLQPNGSGDLTDSYYKNYYNNWDSFLNSLYLINLIDLYLSQFSMESVTHWVTETESNHELPEWNTVEFENWDRPFANICLEYEDPYAANAEFARLVRSRL